MRCRCAGSRLEGRADGLGRPARLDLEDAEPELRDLHAVVESDVRYLRHGHCLPRSAPTRHRRSPSPAPIPDPSQTARPRPRRPGPGPLGPRRHGVPGPARCARSPPPPPRPGSPAPPAPRPRATPRPARSTRIIGPIAAHHAARAPPPGRSRRRGRRWRASAPRRRCSRRPPVLTGGQTPGTAQLAATASTSGTPDRGRGPRTRRCARPPR